MRTEPFWEIPARGVPRPGLWQAVMRNMQTYRPQTGKTDSLCSRKGERSCGKSGMSRGAGVQG